MRGVSLGHDPGLEREAAGVRTKSDELGRVEDDPRFGRQFLPD